MHKNLRSFIEALRKENEIVEIEAQVDPYLEIAEIHRRVIEAQGKALLFKNVKGAKYPVVTNFSARSSASKSGLPKSRRNSCAAPSRWSKFFCRRSRKQLWAFRDMAFSALKLGTKKVKRAPVLEVMDKPANLEELPLLQFWHEDGGHFVTLPLVYTESPTSRQTQSRNVSHSALR
jgi:UbiD family decarboxylase